MANLQIISLDTTTPQLRAPGTGDGYLAPRTLNITPEANTSALTASSYSLTGSNAQSLLDLAGTWNTTGVPTLIKANVVNNASGSGSLLIDLQVGGVTQFRVDKDGRARLLTDLWLQSDATNRGLFFGSAGDIVLHRDAAYTLAQRVGTNAQTFNLYGTYTDASNYRRLSSTSTTAGAFKLNAEGLGTGATGNTLEFATNGVSRLSIQPSANALVNVDIQAFGVRFGGYGGASYIRTDNPNINQPNYSFNADLNTGIYNPAADTIGFVLGGSEQYRMTATAFLFGGTTSSFPALKRNLTGLDVRLADDSAYAPLALGRTLTGTDTDPALFVQGDWSTTGTATLIKANLNADTGPSNAASLLMDLQAAGSSKFSVTKSGLVVSPGIQNNIVSSSANFALYNDGLDIRSSSLIRWSSSTTISTMDLVLARDAAGILAQRNGTNAQAFRIYNTYTDATNTFERGTIKWDSNVLKIGTEKGLVGGTARALELQTDGTTRLTLYATLALVTVPESGNFGFANRTYLSSPANGNLALFNWTGTDFGRLQFGGTTSSFPALKRSSTSLIVRLADDSANAPLESASLKTDAPAGGTAATWKLGAVATVSPTSPNRTIEVDIGGTIYYLHAKTTND